MQEVFARHRDAGASVLVGSRKQAPSVTPASPFKTCFSPHRGGEQAGQTPTLGGVETGELVSGWPLGCTHPPCRRSVALRRGWCRGLLVAVGLRRWRLLLLLLVDWRGGERRVREPELGPGGTPKAPREEPAAAPACDTHGKSVCPQPPAHLGCWAGRGEAAAAAAPRVCGNCCSPGSSCAPARRPRWDSGPSCSSRILRGILSTAPGEDGEVRARLGQPCSAGPEAEPGPRRWQQLLQPFSASNLLPLLPAPLFATKDSTSALSQPPQRPQGVSSPPSSPETFAQTRLWHRKGEGLSVPWVGYAIFPRCG